MSDAINAMNTVTAWALLIALLAGALAVGLLIAGWIAQGIANLIRKGRWPLV